MTADDIRLSILDYQDAWGDPPNVVHLHPKDIEEYRRAAGFESSYGIYLIDGVQLVPDPGRPRGEPKCSS